MEIPCIKLRNYGNYIKINLNYRNYIFLIIKQFNIAFCSCVQKTTCCHIVAVKINNGESVEELKSGNISAAVSEKNDRKKMSRKMKGHRKNSQTTKTLCSVNVETGSHITITNELTKKNLITEKCLSMLIREEVNRDQIKTFMKIDLKNHEEIILSSEFMELDLDEFKLLFHKTA